MTDCKIKTLKLMASFPLVFSLFTQTVIAEDIAETGNEEISADITEETEIVAEPVEENTTVTEEETDPEETPAPEPEEIDEEQETDEPTVYEETENAQETETVEEEDNPAETESSESDNSGFVTVDGKTYYYDPLTHEMIKGAAAIDGEGYFFDEDGVMLADAWKDQGEKGWSYYGSDGRLYRSRWATLSDEKGNATHTYYFTASGYRAAGTVKISGTDVKFAANGVIAALNKGVVIGGNGYFFDSNGIMLVNSWKNYGSKGWAYYGEDGILYRSRWGTLLDENGSAEHNYYFTKSGYRATGGAAINGKGYYFDSKGVMLVNSWKNQGTKGWSYYGENGQLYTSRWSTLADENGKQQHTYYFTKAGYRATGTITISGTGVRFSSNGVIASLNKGVLIGGNGYFFDGSGVMLVNSWKDYGSKGYSYYGSDGRLYKSRWGTLVDENGEAEHKYYFTKSGYRATGGVAVDGKGYYFDSKGIMLVNSWKNQGTNGWSYYGEDGQLYASKWATLIDENGEAEHKYYFTKSGYRATGGTAVDDKGYYFDSKGIMLVSSWKNQGSNGWSYYGEDGQVYASKWATLIDENGEEEHIYYFTHSGYRATGGIAIDGNGYFFNDKGIMLVNSWKNQGARGWSYYGKDGKLYKSVWANLLDENGTAENRYYFGSNGYRVLGLNTISGIKYYFNTKTGALMRDQFIETGGHSIYVDSEGKVAQSSFTRNGTYYAVSPNTGYIMHGPGSFYYFSQTDSRWSGIRYGRWSFGGTGCVPSCIAMAISSLKGSVVSPVNVGDYLYNYTTTFNYGSDIGTAGSGNKLAASHWGINCENINSLSDLKSVLADGMIVAAIVNPGTFCPAGYTHEIVLYGYSDGAVHVYDPLGNATTGWYAVSTVWNQLSTDPLDLDAGNPVYVFYED